MKRNWNLFSRYLLVVHFFIMMLNLNLLLLLLKANLPPPLHLYPFLSPWPNRKGHDCERTQHRTELPLAYHFLLWHDLKIVFSTSMSLSYCFCRCKEFPLLPCSLSTLAIPQLLGSWWWQKSTLNRRKGNYLSRSHLRYHRFSRNCSYHDTQYLPAQACVCQSWFLAQLGYFCNQYYLFLPIFYTKFAWIAVWYNDITSLAVLLQHFFTHACVCQSDVAMGVLVLLCYFCHLCCIGFSQNLHAIVSLLMYEIVNQISTHVCQSWHCGGL